MRLGHDVKTIYFDYNATTPLDPAVKAAMLPFFDEVWGNPSSVHRIGQKARSLLDDARDRVASVFRSRPSEIIFTSGGTESNNLAIFGSARLLRSKGRHLITSQIEHHAVLHCFQYLERKEGFEVTYLPVNSEGFIDPSDLRNAIGPQTTFASLMAANNETGTIQPVAELGKICRDRGVIFHTDAVQWFGKEPFANIQQFNADLVSVCSHKFHGPKGAGALFIRSPLLPDPILFGGGHENDRRAGTENLPSIIGFTEAVEKFLSEPVFNREKLTPFSSDLIQFIDSLEGVTFRGSRSSHLCNTVAFTVADADSIALLAGLDMEGVCASSGSACSAGSLEPSLVMLAMGVDPRSANSLVRFSFGRSTTLGEISAAKNILPLVINRVRTH